MAFALDACRLFTFFLWHTSETRTMRPTPIPISVDTKIPPLRNKFMNNNYTCIKKNFKYIISAKYILKLFTVMPRGKLSEGHNPSSFLRSVYLFIKFSKYLRPISSTNLQ